MIIFVSMSFLKKLKFLLFPFSILYGGITIIRNKMYDMGVLKSVSFPIPIISVGNLSVGGTGKTPHVEYLIRWLKEQKKIAVLSRGYGRKTKGYQLANEESNADILGDEPMQFYSKFGKDITVAVHENRVKGVKKLLKETTPEIILLDDAFQHRAIQPKLSIILTPYDDLFTNDYLLPIGRLRENRSGAKRADIIVVTKCNKQITPYDKKQIINKISQCSKAKVYFSFIRYDTKIYGKNILNIETLRHQNIILVTGIANPKPMLEYLKNKINIITHKKYPDHHNFSKKEAESILKNSKNAKNGKNAMIITTEKDYMRLQKFKSLRKLLYYLPIQVFFDDDEVFNQQVLKELK